ncbi:MAG TPA: ABC transporter ATP-binding protein, partial [Clostridia bacterium]|nr:ABC transporter ATP-binding protein [Clostridia bacterium]
MAEWVIRAQSISKAYGGRTLFHGIDLDIPRGRAIAFVGHNGTGKTTLLKLLAGLVAPSAGRVVRVEGLSTGYVPEHFPKMNLTALQYLRAMGGIEGLSGQEAGERSLALLRSFFMESMADVPMKHLSKGSLQKVGVAQALLRTPDVLLLDEPLSGQDADSQRVFVRRVKALIQGGTTVLLSCHEPFLVRRLA